MATNKPITIGDTQIKPGQRTRVDLPVADLYTTTSLSMPVEVVCGRREGPVLFVCAAIHGDELNGVEIIRRLLNRKSIKSIRGTLVAVPIVNVHGFLDQSRYLPDRRDLNRSFPGSPRGSIAARLAHLFMTEIVAKADYGIDLHTGAVNRSNLPQIRANLDDNKTLQLAKAFGVPVMINADLRDGSLRACASDLGLPMLLYEAGEALRFNETGIRAGVRGIVNVMNKIGMVTTTAIKASAKSKSRVKSVVAHSTRWVRAGASGIVTAAAPVGDRVRKGEKLAAITAPLGGKQEFVTAPFDGIIIGRSNSPLAHEGDALFHVAQFADVPSVENIVEDFTLRTEGSDKST